MTKHKIIYGALAAALATGAASCSDDVAGTAPSAKGERVTAIASGSMAPAGLDSRTERPESTDGTTLDFCWNAQQAGADRVVLFEQNTTVWLGTMAVTSGFGSANATLTGDLWLDKAETPAVVSYLGNAAEVGADYDAATFAINTATQSGLKADLSQLDVMTATASVERGDNGASVSFSLTSVLAFGKLKLNIPAGVTVSAENPVVITGPKSAATYSLTDGTVSDQSGDAGISITGLDADNTVYFAFLPGTYPLTVSVKSDDGSATYIAEIESSTYEANVYYHDGRGNAPELELTDPDAPAEDPDSPGNPDNWGSGEDVAVDYNTTGSYWDFSTSSFGTLYQDGTKTSSVICGDFWTNERSMYHYGGWATWIEYNNGIASNILTSNSTAAIYFQWGRIMGFPSNVTREPNTYGGGNATPSCFGTAGNPGSYTMHYEVDYLGSALEGLLRPYVFGRGASFSSHLDWIQRNESCTWEDRTGNPCPDGYRVPTPEEMSVFVPSTGSVNGSYAEVKNVNGQKVAVEWTVTSKSSSTNGKAYVSIRMAKTNQSTVSVGDAIFNDSKTIRLLAFGYLMDDGNRGGYGTTAIYWTNATGNAGDLIENGVSGNGGQALYIEFSGTTATMMLAGVPRSFGAQVLPFKDETAKGVTYRPWCPYANKWPGY